MAGTTRRQPRALSLYGLQLYSMVVERCKDVTWLDGVCLRWLRGSPSGRSCALFEMRQDLVANIKMAMGLGQALASVIQALDMASLF